MAAKIIFVLSEARTGSTFLCQLLTRFQPTLDLQEVFNLNKIDLYTNTGLEFNKLLDYHYRDVIGDVINDPTKPTLEFINDPMKLLSLLAQHFQRTLIVKIHLHQLQMFSDQNINLILSSANHKFILLNRSNFLELYISLMTAGASGIWNTTDTSNSMIKIDEDEFRRTFNEHQTKYASIKKKLQDHNIDYLYINYDLDLKNYNDQKFIDLVKPWLINQGLTLNLSKELPSTILKQNNSIDISHNILDYDELPSSIKLNNDGIVKVKIKN